MNRSDRDLGMDRAITRRDFLNGLSVTIGGALTAPACAGGASEPQQRAPEPAASDYPPARTGMRGSHPGSFEVAHSLRDAKMWTAAEDTRERYDLVVVGGGMSGLASAYFFRKAVGPDAKILILDNHDDFGGHAKRNEFRYGNRIIIGYGGTQSIEAPNTYTLDGRMLLQDIGVDPDRFRKATAPDRNLRSASERIASPGRPRSRCWCTWNASR